MSHLFEEDEESFILHEEQIIYQIQSLLHIKEGLETKPVLEISTKLEDLLYHQTLKNFSLSSTANIWTKKEYIHYYHEQTEKFLFQLKNKSLNWKKLFEDQEKNPQNILKQIMKEEEGGGSSKKKHNNNSSSNSGGNNPNRPPKVPKELKEGLIHPSSSSTGLIPPGGATAGGLPAPGGGGKAKGSKGGTRVKKEDGGGGGGGGSKGGKKKPPKKEETTLSLDAAIDDINMFADPMDTEPFDDNLFGSGDVDLFDGDALEMDDLFKFGSNDDLLKF